MPSRAYAVGYRAPVTGHVSGWAVERMPGKRALIISGLAAVVFTAVLLLDRFQPFAYARLRWLYSDAISRAGRTTPPNPDLVFLAVDAASVSLDETDIDGVFGLSGDTSPAAQTLRLMSKRFPWSRDVYAALLDRLIQSGARAVTFDLTFPGPTGEDAKFRGALDRYREHVLIASNFVDGSLTRPTEALVPQTAPMDDRVAYANFWPDDDDVVRRARYRATFDEVRDTAARTGSERFLSLAAGAMRKAGFSHDVPEDLNNHPFRFTLPSFPAHSLFRVFVPSYWKQDYQSGEFFRGKIVVVGAEGNWQHDEHQTPFGLMPGAELHLNAINAALHHEFIREMSPPGTTLFTLAMALLGIALSLVIRSPWLRLVSLLLLCLGSVWAGLAVFNRASIFVPMVGPLSQLTLTGLLGLVCDFTSERIEKNRVRRALERYMSRDVVREMVDQPKLYKQSLGGVIKPVAVLFSDIRSYSAVTARSSPELLVAQLNEYFTAMVECVFDSGGTLDKFIGDAVMAVWGSLHSGGPRNDAMAAVNTARAMQARLVLLNRSWRDRGWPELRVGIAINHGQVVVGNIGSPQRMEFTVIGDAVNVTWKLQELTKDLGRDLLISDSVHVLIADRMDLQSLGMTEIRGLPLPLEVFTLAQSRGHADGAPSAEKSVLLGVG